MSSAIARMRAASVVLATVFAYCARGATPAQVDHAILKGKQYLYSQQKNGSWEKAGARDPTTRASDLAGGQWGGSTALATYALLASGESHQADPIKKAVEFLTKADMVGVYALGMRANVWNLLPKSEELKKTIGKDQRLLLAAVKTDGATRGLYDYLDTGPGGSRFDHSASQYGVIGVWACAENIEGVGSDYWKLVDDAWRRNQLPSGAWCYGKTPSARYPETVAMTAAGVATLFITQDFLARAKSGDASGNVTDDDIERGIKWIAANYRKVYEKDTSQYHHPYYGLYGIERIGVASGYKYIGQANWYEEGAEFLVKNQGKDGKWGSGVVDTSFALLFLARGRAPLIMNKLQYTIGDKPEPGNWNQRHRDVPNLAKFVGNQAERSLNWQIVTLKAPVDDLHDAPILYVSGNQALNFSNEQKQKLKQYIEEGGLLMAHADGGSKPFAESIRKLGTELFDYEFRPLPASHVIYTEEQFLASKWRRKANLLGLSNGIRELMLLIPDGDPSRYWQGYDISGRSEVFELVANIFQYAIDKQNLRNKGETYIVRRDERTKPGQTIKLARLEYSGAWDPEPGGWRRLAAVMHNTLRTTLAIENVPLRNLASTDATIAHLTGTNSFTLDAEERLQLKGFVEGGGVLIVDAAGGSTAFAQSAELEFEAIFGAAANSLKDPLPPEHNVYRKTGKLDIAWRAYSKRNVSGDLRGGRIRMMLLKDKPAVIYSPDDLSNGLLGAPVDGVLGYEPATASALMTNIIVIAAGR